jgi:hypothetical protein
LWQVDVFPSVDVTEQLPFPPSQEQFIITFPGRGVSAADSFSWPEDVCFSPSVPRLMTESVVFGIALSIALVPPGL